LIESPTSLRIIAMTESRGAAADDADRRHFVPARLSAAVDRGAGAGLVDAAAVHDRRRDRTHRLRPSPRLRVLLDVLHPAHVHFFRHAIAELEGRGCELLVTARDKDLTLALLEALHIRHRTISRSACTRLGLARELALRNLRLLTLVRRERPDVLASIGGISTAQVGFLTRTPNLVFYDTECASLSNRLSYPFASQVITPDCYHGRPPRRHVRYAGYHELAYLHPRRFTPDAGLLTRSGIDPHTPFSVVRFVSRGALHDRARWSLGRAERSLLIRRLAEVGRVFVSTEATAVSEPGGEPIPLPAEAVHHLLAFASVYLGESATMASESAVLGTPAILIDPQGRGYTDELERRYELCTRYPPPDLGRAIAQARAVLAAELCDTPERQRRRRRLLADKIDVTGFVVDRLLGVATGRRDAA
jgi:hypothetical protein